MCLIKPVLIKKNTWAQACEEIYLQINAFFDLVMV